MVFGLAEVEYAHEYFLLAQLFQLVEILLEFLLVEEEVYQFYLFFYGTEFALQHLHEFLAVLLLNFDQPKYFTCSLPGCY